MKINVCGNLHLSSSLHNYVEEKLKQEAVKLFDNDLDINVSFNKNGKLIQSVIILKEIHTRGLIVKSHSESDDAYSAFDLAFTRMSKQLRKHKEKVKNYRKTISNLKAQNIDLPFIIANRNIINEKIKEIESESEQQINIIASKTTEIESLTVEDAVMKMDLLELSGFVFLNKNFNNRINFIYKRPDGNLSWINPSEN